MKIEEINKVCFVGAGSMGCFNALTAAIAGYQAVLYDVSTENLEQVRVRLREIAAMLTSYGLCSQDVVDNALIRIVVNETLEAAVSDADLVSESVFESLQVKREVHQQLDRVLPPQTILTTNTSTLLVSQIEDVVERGNLFAALHSHLGSPLIDIVGGPRTSPATIDILQRYVTSLHCVPLVLKKENPGYVLNAMLGPLLTTAMKLVIGNMASKESVDQAWMRNRNAPMGPFGMMDLFGLNIIYDSWQYKESTPEIDKDKESILAFLTPFIERGELGMKAGKGFYQYPEPAYQQESFNNGDDISVAGLALTSIVVVNAISLAVKGILEPDDIDLAWKAGTHLDTGPFAMLDAIGLEEFLLLLRTQCERGLCSSEQFNLVEGYLLKQSAQEV
jgi:enoyl-CoA hydratase / 3-hydroxyacyl-CoA dehydrogenase